MIRTASPTPAQMRALRLAAAGMGQKAIAAHLGISYQTVKNQIYDACARLGVSGMVEAFVVLGWLNPDGIAAPVVERDVRALRGELRALATDAAIFADRLDARPVATPTGSARDDVQRSDTVRASIDDGDYGTVLA